MAPILSLIGLYAAGVAVLSGVVALRRRPLPERVDPGDLAMIAVATYKISRRLAKDTGDEPAAGAVHAVRRHPGPAELAESVRGTGLRHAVGEVLTCPFCLSQWVATGLQTAERLGARRVLKVVTRVRRRAAMVTSG